MYNVNKGDLSRELDTSIPLRMLLMQDAMSKPSMYMSPYQPSLVQQLGVFGASMLGYENPYAVPFVGPGQSVYDSMYAARPTTQLYGTMQQNFNRDMGQMFASAAYRGATRLGGTPRADSFRNAGESTIGSAVAGAMQQSPVMQQLMGGDVSRIYDNMFANRQTIAFGNRLVDPNSRSMQAAAAQYTEMVSRGLTRMVYTDDNGKFSPIIPNTSITHGYDVGELGQISNALTTLDPKSAGMSNKLTAVMRDAHKAGRKLTPAELEMANMEADKTIEHHIGMIKALGELGDTLNSPNLMSALQSLNTATGGQASNLTEAAALDFVRGISAAHKVYGVDGNTQIAMQAQFGAMYAAGSGGVDTITGKSHSPLNALISGRFKTYAMTMAAESGISAGDATAYMASQIQTATGSRAGRMGQLIESAYRTGGLTDAHYAAFHQAATKGDLRNEGALMRAISTEMYGTADGLQKAIQDPNALAGASRVLGRLAPEERKQAANAISERLIYGPQQEIRYRAIEHTMQSSRDLVAGVYNLTGVSGVTKGTQADREQAVIEGYRSYFKTQADNATKADEQQRATRKRHLFEEAAVKGFGAVKDIIGGVSVFQEDHVGLTNSAQHALDNLQLHGAVGAFATLGNAKQWMMDAYAASVGDKPLQQRIRAAHRMMQTDPDGANAEMDAIYGLLSPGAKMNIRDPKLRRAAITKLMDNDTRTAISKEYEKQYLKDQSTTWTRVAKEKTGATDDEVSTANMIRSATTLKQSAEYQAKMADPVARLEINKRLTKGMDVEEAIFEVLGPAGDGKMMADHMRALSLAAGDMGLTAEQLLNSPNADRVDQRIAAWGEQMHAQSYVDTAHANMKLTTAQRIVKYGLQLDDDKEKISLLDVMGIQTDERQATEANKASKDGKAKQRAMVLADKTTAKELSVMSDKKIQKRFGALGEERVNALKLVRANVKGTQEIHGPQLQGWDYVNPMKLIAAADHTLRNLSVSSEDAMAKHMSDITSLDTLPITEANIKLAKDADEYNEAMEDARVGKMKKLNALSDKVGTEIGKAEGGAGERWWEHGIWGTAKRFRYKRRVKQLKTGAREKMLSLAQSGGTMDVSNMEAVQDEVAVAARNSIIDKERESSKKGGASGGGAMRIKLEASNITIDMGGERHTGTIAGEGYGY